MQARPNKCSATAMRQSNSVGSSGITRFDRFDPHLTSIRYLDDGDFRYLGRLLNTAASEITSRCQLQKKLDALLSLLDKTLLPATSRLWLYHHFVVPKLSWAFLTPDLTLTFVKKLQAKLLVFLKKWVGLPRCANTAILFLGDRHRHGLKVHNLCTYWKQQQVLTGLEKSGCIVAFCDWNARFCDQKTWCSRNFAPKTRRPGASLRPDEHSSRPDSENKN